MRKMIWAATCTVLAVGTLCDAVLIGINIGHRRAFAPESMDCRIILGGVAAADSEAGRGGNGRMCGEFRIGDRCVLVTGGRGRGGGGDGGDAVVCPRGFAQAGGGGGGFHPREMNP